MVSSEAAPYAKTGGLADVLSALPKALGEAGEEVAVVLPYYRNSAVSNPRQVYERLTFGLGPHRYSANIFETIDGGARYLFVQIPELYDRPSLYGEPDDHLRFGALCQAALGVARHLFMPHIIHGHDWQAGLLPVFLKDSYAHHPAVLRDQNRFDDSQFGLPRSIRAEYAGRSGTSSAALRLGVLEFYGSVNFLKADW